MIHNMSDAPIFIVGCGRSGTSLLRDLLRSHPHITFPGESYFIPQIYAAYGNPRTDREARTLAAIILNLFWVTSWNIQLEPSAFSHCRSYRHIVSKIYGEYAKREHKTRWGDKTPSYVLSIPTLVEIFPSCQIIHIYRDGRDVALSYVPFIDGPNNIFAAAHYWKTCVSEGREQGTRLGSSTYLEVRYETLITDPQSTMTRICTFLDEPFSDAVLTLNYLENLVVPRVFGKPKPIPISTTTIVSTNHGKWKNRLSPSDQVTFESVAGNQLRAFGYEANGITRHISAFETTSWSIHHYVFHIVQRLNRGQKMRWVPSHLFLRWAFIRSLVRMCWAKRRQSWS